MKLFILPIFLLILSFQTRAQFLDAKNYCVKNPIKGISHLIPAFDSSTQITFNLHAYTKLEFDKNLPSLIFVSGGPGSSPRDSEFNLQGYNVIFFEQRGMGCSRPDELSEFLNPLFYSSLNTAYDIYSILNYFKIDSAFIYGHSYGTIPATVFASLFPLKVKNLILEGIIGIPDIRIWKSEIRKQQLQKTFNNLSPNLQDKIISYSRSNNIPNNWFSIIGNMMSYLDNGYETYTNFLNNVLTMEEEDFEKFVSNFYTNKILNTNDLETLNDGDITFGMITCQELAGTNSDSSMGLIFDKNNILQWDNNNKTFEQFCSPLEIFSPSKFDFAQYKVNAPITYLVGELDGATDFEQARYHAQHLGIGDKRFLVLKNGGHLPNLSALKDNRPCHDVADCDSMLPIKTQVNFFHYILQNSTTLSKDDLQKFNQNLPLNWEIFAP